MITKNKHTSNILTGDEHPLVKIFVEFTQLKQLYRQGWLKRGVSKEYCESVADHVYNMMMLSYISARELRPDLDITRVMELTLIHETGEIEEKVGDRLPGEFTLEEKSRIEYEAVKKLFSSMPNPDKYISLWREYDEQKTPEAIFVKQIDKLERGLQARIYAKQGFNGLDEFFPDTKTRVTLPELKPVLDYILKND